jgi:hypothetical protein
MLDAKKAAIPFVNGVLEIAPEVINDGTFKVQRQANQELNICDRSRKIPDRIFKWCKDFVCQPPVVSTRDRK